MKHLITTGFAAALLLALAGGTPAAAQGDAGEAERLSLEIARMKRDVQRADNDLRRTDSLAAAEQAGFAKSRERAARDLERRAKENAALEARVRESRARAVKERSRGDGYVAAAAEIKAREKAALEFLMMVTDTLRSRVERGMPWDIEARRDRVLALRRDMEAGTTPPDEAFGRLLALVREETKNGDEATLSSRAITRADGEVINAQVLRIGNQAAVYVDDEGRNYGILEPRMDSAGVVWSWRENLSLSERTVVKRAVMVKGGREAPQLVPLEIPLVGLRTVGDAEGGR
ncbi:MAG TPA: DUF3450 family protein [Fibrobacteria bacterium]|jgi:hypothetical protein|nr:DUF3450 family protein [Fibrobacteria bacterium]